MTGIQKESKKLFDDVYGSINSKADLQKVLLWCTFLMYGNSDFEAEYHILIRLNLRNHMSSFQYRLLISGPKMHEQAQRSVALVYPTNPHASCPNNLHYLQFCKTNGMVFHSYR